MSASRRITAFAAFVVLATLPTAALAAPPSNDTRAGATDVSTLPYSSTQNTKDATAEASDPNGCSGQGDHTVWFRYSAQTDGRLVASTAGSTYTTQVQVLEQSGPSLTSVGCAADFRPSGVAVAFPVRSGRSYFVAVARPDYSETPEEWKLTFSLREQPVINVTLERSAFISRATNAVTMTGIATCSEPVSVSLSPTVRQEQSRKSAYAYNQSYLDCTPTEQRFDVTIPKQSSASFAGGKAWLTGLVEVPGEGYRQEVDQEVSLTVCTLIGTAGDDVLEGTPGADRICGLPGDDEIIAGGGNDVVFGGMGNDVLRLGKGNDWAAGGDGRDRILGQSGNDTLQGGAGRDLLTGGKGYDRCTGGDGRDRFRGCEARKQ